jgi:hypothetical protein
MYKGLTRALGALLALVALYSLLGFLILPGVALRIANQQLAHTPTCRRTCNASNSTPSALS